jgi:hypothetical protein
MDDIAVDKTGGNMLLFVGKVKGDQCRTAADKPLLQVPIDAVPLQAGLLEAFTFGRTRYYNQLNNGLEPATFWAVTHDETPPHTWTAWTITEWNRETCSAIGASPPPPQFKWTSHSLRNGAASAAACIGAPFTKIRYMGGWSKTSDVNTGNYIDHVINETPAASLFFGWLVAKPPD